MKTIAHPFSRAFLGAVACTLIGSHAYASGILMPSDKSLPALAIKYQRVNIEITDGVADVAIEQVFQNNVNRDLEAVYVFPLPEDAAIADFAMMINGQRVSGELVEKDKARDVYEGIVRRMKDPGLLEHMGGRLFRVRVFPVVRNGEQKIELSYSQTLAFDGGMYSFVYPLKTGDQASRTLEDFTVKATLSSAVPLKTMYSPSHKISVSRKGENKAIIGFEESQGLLDRDFVLYYGVSKKDFGLNLLTHKAGDDDGFFMMLLSPTVTPPDAAVVKRDIVFVTDTSGSMAGDKIHQAKEALRYCVNSLNEGDHFGIVRFSTDVESLAEELMPVSAENRKKAEEFVDRFEARGGTDIDSALEAALALRKESKRPYTIAFLTDGKPTIGVTETKEIVERVAKNNAGGARVFVFGVGETVNTHLLDKISGGHGGMSTYVKPEQDIEVVVSAFYDKISHPVLANPKVTVPKLKVRQLHPRELPNLFSGNQLLILGRYAKGGHVAVHLDGDINEEHKEFVYETTFADENHENDFIPRLWATRRVGYLLDQIRLNGEEPELRDEVMALSREYGIMTPYTSYLILEDDKAYVTHGIPRTRGKLHAKMPMGGANEPVVADRPGLDWSDMARDADDGRSGGRGRLGAGRATAAPESAAPASARPAPVPVFGQKMDQLVSGEALEGSLESASEEKSKRAEVDGYFRQDAGKAAIDLSETIHTYKNMDESRVHITHAVRYVGKKIFTRIDGVWIDKEYEKSMKATRVTYASDEYFTLLIERPELKKYFALGEKVIVVIEPKLAVIVE